MTAICMECGTDTAYQRGQGPAASHTPSKSLRKCARGHDFHDGYFYEFAKHGEAFRTFRAGRYRRISNEAEWVTTREGATRDGRGAA